MSLSPAIIDAMLAAGCTALQIAEAVKASLREEEEQRAEARERRRIQNRVRQQKYRDNSKARNATLRVIERYDALLPSSPNSPKGFSPTPPFPKPLNPSNPITPLAPLKGGIPPTKNSLSAAFSTFWSRYPKRVGRRDAEKAFERAGKRADFDAIMAGLDRYVRKRDDRPWCNPATWLNQDRWTDEEYEDPIPQNRRPKSAVQELTEKLANGKLF